MRTSSTLLSFLATTCLLLGCQKEPEKGFSLTIQGRWPADLARNERSRTELFRVWHHTEVQIKDSGGREERLIFPRPSDLRSRPLARLQFEKPGEYEMVARVAGAKTILYEGSARFTLNKEVSRLEVGLKAR